MSSDVKLERMGEHGVKQQTAGAVVRTIAALRVHLGIPGEANMLCGKARSELKSAAGGTPRDLCRDCVRKAREQHLSY